MEKLRVLDLFSGIGGFSLGLERTGGFETVAFCEIEEFPRRVLAKHWPEVPCYHDVRELTAERIAADGIAVDAICGGFPCQDLSTSGTGLGLDGERSGLWHEYFRIICEVRPSYVIVENSPELLDGWLGDILGALASIGYNAEWDCIPAAAVGAPHRRDRFWLVAHARGVEHESCGTPISGALAAELSRTIANATTMFGQAVVGSEPDGDQAGAGALADAARELRNGSGLGAEQAGRDESANGGAAMADAHSIGLGRSGLVGEGKRAELASAGQETAGSLGGRDTAGSWWSAEPDVGRVAHGVPPELDGGLSGKELDQAASPKGVPSPRKVRGVRRNRKAGEAPPVIQRAGAGGDTLPPLPCEGRPARRAPEDQATEGLCPLRSGIHAEAQQEAHALQRGMQVDRWPHERDEALASVWSEEPGVPRVAQGVKHRVDRLRCLGNAVVPQIPELIGNAILAAHRATSAQEAA